MRLFEQVRSIRVPVPDIDNVTGLLKADQASWSLSR